MTLTLRIENETTLPDGGPLSVSIKGKRGLDIGRDAYLDWTLPDPSRFISGRHCEVRWHDGAYWLHDISTNGTFVNGADSRLKAPHRLRDGDRFVIGHYVIAATLEGEAVEQSEAVAAPRSPSGDDDLWGGLPNAAAPVDPQQLKAPRDAAPVRPDFLDWAVDVPAPAMRSAAPAPGSPSPAREKPAANWSEHDSWAEGPTPPPAAPPEMMPQPNPRRPNGGDVKRSRPAPEPDPSVIAQRNADGDAAQFVQHLARGAGLPEEAFAGRNPDELAEQVGRLLRLAADGTRQLLEARQQARRLARSPNQTTVQAVNNNPLKFSPTTDDALRTMFGHQGQSYLDAEKAFAQAFDDLKKHQLKTYTAMQQAVTLLVRDVDPASIESASQSDSGLAALVGSRKARLWDVYVARWQALTQRHDNGLLDRFMDYFAQRYDG